MDWQRERDGLAVVAGVALVGAVVLAGGSVERFGVTLAATFLGVLAALQFDGWLDARAGTGATDGSDVERVPAAHRGTDGTASSEDGAASAVVDDPEDDAVDDGETDDEASG